MRRRKGWTWYAPLDGPPPDTSCGFCGTPFPGESEQGWVIAKAAAICGRCLRRLASADARREGKSLDEWASNA